MKHLIWYPRLVLVSLFLIIAFVSSCSYKERVQPIKLPSASRNSVSINGLQIAAVAFEDQQTAKEAFGFDIRGAGLLPVQLVFQNEGEKPVTLLPEQTFMIDSQNQAWPINSLDRTYKRVEKHAEIGETVAGTAKPALLLGAAGAIAGLAVGIVTGENVGEAMGKGAVIGGAAGAIGGGASGYLEAERKIQRDLADKALENKAILPNQIAYGILFFPGFAEEARDAAQLKLTLSFNGTVQSVTIDLRPGSDESRQKN